MRKNHKKGFTLVECVVAMAILVVMALLLSMLLTATVNLRNHNKTVENEIDEQVDKLASKQDLTEQAITDSGISFNNGIIIPGTNAKKLYFEDSNVQMGAIDYGFNDIELPSFDDEDDPSDSDDEGDDAEARKARKVYGAVETSSVTITEEVDPVLNDGVYTMKWRIMFTASSCSEVKSLKIVLPSGADNVYYDADWKYTVHGLGDRVVRICPKSNQSITLSLTFTVPESSYVYYEEAEEGKEPQAKPESFYHYFKGVTGGNTVTLTKQSSGEFK